MSIVEKFVAFTAGLPADRLSNVEAALAGIMASHAENYDFHISELAVLDHRIAESAPEFSDPADIEKLFGKNFSA